MRILKLEEWLEEKERSHRYNQLKVEYSCKQCGKLVTKRPSALNKKNLNRLFCCLSCSTTYRNLNDGVPAQKEGWKEKWLAVRYVTYWRKESKIWGKIIEKDKGTNI